MAKPNSKKYLQAVFTGKGQIPIFNPDSVYFLFLMGVFRASKDQ